VRFRSGDPNANAGSSHRSNASATSSVSATAALQAVYEVQAGDQSLRGLVQGGYDISTNAARLDGTVLGGRLTGEHMHVEFVALPCSQSNAGSQSNAAGGTCFQGKITVTPRAAS